MLGLGEKPEEVLDVMRDLRAQHVDILTLGPISAAVAEAPADRALRPAGGVRRVPPRRDTKWVSRTWNRVRWCAARIMRRTRCGRSVGRRAGAKVSLDHSIRVA